MNKAIDHSTLTWVKKELDETLREARQTLETHVKNPQDRAQLGFLAAHLHQVYGTLQMVELYGASLLAEEMESVAKALAENSVSKQAEACEVLMRAILQLPDYLDRLIAGSRDIPLVLLPILNDLRAVRGENLLSENAMFSPDLSAKLPEGVIGANAASQVRAPAKELRHTFQRGLLGWLRGTDVDQSLTAMSDVLRDMLKMSSLDSVARLWWVAGGVVSSLIDHSLGTNASINRLLGQVDRQMKRMMDEGESVLDQAPALDLFKNLLFYAAQSQSEEAQVREIQNTYGLRGLVPNEQEVAEARESMAGQNADLYATVAIAVKEELSRLKDSLDLVLRSARKKPEELAPLIQSLRSLSDTLGMLGLDAPRKAMVAKASELHSYREAGDSPPETLLMDIASTLLFVESAVESMGAGRGVNSSNEEPDEQLARSEYGQVMDVVFQEAINDLARGKEAIIAYTESGNEAVGLDTVPLLFNQVKGGLLLLGETRAAALIGSAAKYVENELCKKKEQPAQNELDSLADAICGLEYYLEGRREHRMYGGVAMTVAEESVGKLGYPAETTFGDESDATLEIAGNYNSESWCASGEACLGEDQNAEPGHEQRAAVDMDALGIDEESNQWKPSDPKLLEEREDSISDVEEAGPKPSADEQSLDAFAETISEDGESQLQIGGAGTDTGVVEQVTYEARAASDRNASPEADTAAGAPEFGSTIAQPGEETAAEKDDLAIIGNEVDEEILEIFIEEAEEEIARIGDKLPIWTLDTDNAEALGMVRRSFHTLKGSGRLVGAMRIGEFAWAFENLLNRVIEGSLPTTAQMISVLEEARATLPELVEQIKSGTPVQRPVAHLVRCAEALGAGTVLPESDGRPLPGNTVSELDVEPLQTLALPLDEAIAGAGKFLDCDDEIPAKMQSDGVMDSMLYEIFNTEARGHLETIRQFLNQVSAGDAKVDESLARALHTLHGSAHMANAGAIADLSGELERYTKALLGANVPMSEEGCDVVQGSAQMIENMLACLPFELDRPHDFEAVMANIRDLRESVAPASTESPHDDYADDDTEVAEVAISDITERPRQTVGTVDPYSDCDHELLEIFLEESEENLETADLALHSWRQASNATEAVADLQRAMHTLKGGARMADLVHVSDLAHAVETLVASIAERATETVGEALDAVQEAHDSLVSMLDAVRLQQPIEAQNDLIAKLIGLAEYNALAESEPVPDPQCEIHPANAESETSHPELHFEAGSGNPYVETDPELLEVFLEEAGDILEHSEETLRAWRADPQNTSLVAELQRELHTMKGGARMADVTEIGDLAHAVESLMVKVTEGGVMASPPLFEVLEQAHDSLNDMIQQVIRREPIAEPRMLMDRLEALLEGKELPVQVVPAAQSDAKAATTQSAGLAVTMSDAENRERRTKTRDNQELVRVKAKLLDNMVNYAGEVSIYRSRLEQQVGAFRFNLVEMEQTVARLREQLRKLEIETEAQILFRYETESEELEEQFDPLEMDRYSHMQQLSRSLVESVSDLGSIQTLLENITGESETLLLQQSRVNTELQEGLMRTRMVPFLGLAARMRRIVRQTCQAMGKRAELELSGAEGEMDRTVVDRIVAPIEHMLRNAISHGIEAPDERRAKDKPEAGTIRITLERESSDVVLRIADDGAGINLTAIRKKAIERGLMKSDSDLTDTEVLQFILETGFSTADKVTQVAGRGVGMDVVNSEVKQLGGSLHIDSRENAGTTFTIRLPFTLALNQALLIEVGEDTYAVPLSSIEGIVRMPRADIKKYYDDETARFAYGGHEYEVRHLGTLLGTGQLHIDSGPKRIPLLLTRVNEHCVAFQVENLMGSREIVVKSVGPQISTVRGVSGATILGDGRVVMILDLPAMLRGGVLNPMTSVEEIFSRPARKKGLTVMVVDDSITVRKVTTRLLERNDMNVIAAKDGVDAVSKLQENIPDVMLLDIEMPRMDGFELATHVRNEPRLRHVPIIMITSRTGDKHRQRAMQIGVNRYLGKPFQEAELLDNIKALLEE